MVLYLQDRCVCLHISHENMIVVMGISRHVRIFSLIGLSWKIRPIFWLIWLRSKCMPFKLLETVCVILPRMSTQGLHRMKWLIRVLMLRFCVNGVLFIRNLLICRGNLRSLSAVEKKIAPLFMRMILDYQLPKMRKVKWASGCWWVVDWDVLLSSVARFVNLYRGNIF